MNRPLGLLLPFFLILAPLYAQTMGAAEEKDNSRDPLAPLSPGMTWRVEILPASKRGFVSNWQFRTDVAGGAHAGSKNENTPLQILEENVLIGNIRRQVLHLDRGHTIVRYAVGSFIIYEQSAQGEYSVELSGDDAYGGPLNSRRFQEFGWIRPGFQVGTTSIDGVKCDIYEAPWPLPQSRELLASTAPAHPTPGPKIYAAISIADRLPVRLEDPLQIRRYVFESSQASDILPAGVMEALRKQQEAVRHELLRYKIPQ